MTGSVPIISLVLVVLFFTSLHTIIIEARGETMMTESQEIKTISAAEANRIISERTDVTVIDVRTPGEFNSGHVAGAINIDYSAPDFEKIIGGLDRAKFYLVYCRSGHRSSGAVKVMKRLKFKKVYDFGGIMQWKAAGFPVR